MLEHAAEAEGVLRRARHDHGPRASCPGCDDARHAHVTGTFDDDDVAFAHWRLRTALRHHFEIYSAEVQVLAEIERVARNDEQVNAIRLEHYQQYYDEMAASIRELQRRGMADPALDPAIISAALGALVWRFAEVWLSFEYVSCDLDEAVEQITRIFVKVLRPEGGHGPLTAP